VLVGEEAELPYHRPALSKKYLRGEQAETPYVEDEAFYRDHDVELLLGSAVTGVDPGARRLDVAGTQIAYAKLLLASGAHPRRLDVPGAALDGVFALRTVGDSAAIRDAAAQAGRAVVVGGGFIGMEAAASLRTLGLEVTLIHLGSGLFDQLRCEALSAELASLYRERGVEVLLEEEVARFRGTSALAAVETRSGLVVEAELAVVGVGVVPAVGFLAGSGLALDNGVVVDDRFATAVPGVYAAGDVAAFFDPLYGRRRRVEHWSNARYQGTEAGKVLAGAEGGYDTVSSFFSEVFGVTIKVFGDAAGADEVAVEGSLAAGEVVVRYGERGKVAA
jgi:NADPH-dependent 2,4-dienoyl-CoA reductase/sulfur reductase-like enzyme